MAKTKAEPKAEKPKKADKGEDGEKGRDRRAMMDVGGRSAYKSSRKDVRDIDPGAVVCNSSNPRKPLPHLYDMGYDLFTKRADSNKQYTLREMALSDDPELRLQFCTLIEKHEATVVKDTDEDGSEVSEVRNGIPQLADSIVMYGLLNPVTLRVIRSHDNPDFIGKYDLIAGARRYFSILYLNAKRLQKYPVPAMVHDADDEKAGGMALDENITVRPMSRGDMIRKIGEEVRLGASPDQIAAKFGTNARTVERRLNAYHAGPELLAMLDRGEVGIVDVEKIGLRVKSGEQLEAAREDILSRPTRRQNKPKGGGTATPKGGGGSTTKKKALSVKDAHQFYLHDEGLHEKVRNWLWTYFDKFDGAEPNYRTLDQIAIEGGEGGDDDGEDERPRRKGGK